MSERTEWGIGADVKIKGRKEGEAVKKLCRENMNDTGGYGRRKKRDTEEKIENEIPEFYRIENKQMKIVEGKGGLLKQVKERKSKSSVVQTSVSKCGLLTPGEVAEATQEVSPSPSA